MTLIAITGANGFIGRHVVERLAQDHRHMRLRLLAHRTRPPLPEGENEVVPGDLGDPASLQRLCDGANVVFHLATYTGRDESACVRVNSRGTAALVAAARRARVPRIVYVSNAAIYGYAVHRGTAEEDASPAPATPISRSRAAAERVVLDAGGTVLRPLFVDGNGDTHFVPAILKTLCRRSSFTVRGGNASLSLIGVGELARAIVGVSLASEARGVFHASNPRPTTLQQIVKDICQEFGLPVPRWSLPYPAAKALLRLRSAGRGAEGWGDSSAHRLFLVSHDHYYDSSRLWSLLAWEPSSSFADRIHQAREWYAPFLREPRP